MREVCLHEGMGADPGDTVVGVRNRAVRDIEGSEYLAEKAEKWGEQRQSLLFCCLEAGTSPDFIPAFRNRLASSEGRGLGGRWPETKSK